MTTGIVTNIRALARRLSRNELAQRPARVTGNDFCQLFSKEMKGLYLLALLLTANPETAELCFVSALEGCMKGVAVATDWAHLWAKRAVIKNAIRLMRPNLESTTPTAREGGAQGHYQAQAIIHNVLALRDSERIVFVMCVLERYSDRDSAAMLGCLPQEIREARVRALQHVAGF